MRLPVELELPALIRRVLANEYGAREFQLYVAELTARELAGQELCGVEQLVVTYTLHLLALGPTDWPLRRAA